MRRIPLVLLCALPVCAAPRPKATPPPAPTFAVEAARLAALKARSIGPAVMGGRVSDIAVDPANPEVWYVALGTGGVMKTADGGTSFSGVFEKEAVAAVGAVAVSPAKANVVWAGTGEANDRNSSSWGNGVYRSTDGGSTWKNVGLGRSRTVARIVAHPTDPETAWVAAMGDLWTPGGERGLYRTTDGGKSWTRLLAAPAPDDAVVGCGDVAVDPQHPDTVFAALYARRRTPWSFAAGVEATGGKDLGGIFKSTDGGATWKKLTNGLPAQTGRIGLSLSAKDPRVVMAVVQSDLGGAMPIRDNRSRNGGVFRSENGGESWTRTNPLDPRPFYFSQIRVDPQDARRVYVLGFSLHVSDDGGKSFREDLGKKLHPDLHAMAVLPDCPPHGPKDDEEKDAPPKVPAARRILLGTDGGLYESRDAAKSFAMHANFAAGEFYRITLDDSAPYRIAGGLQDNNSWLGPSRTFTKDGIVNSDWIALGGGDGFSCAFDPDDRDVLYMESQEGELERVNLRNGERKELRPAPAEGSTGFRFHWNAPFFASRHAKGTIYLGGNRVFSLTKRGEEWKAISPDLSAREVEKILATGSGAETYGVVYTLEESPVAAGLLWAGTDDGKLWRTEDAGAHWTDLTPFLPAAAKGQWIARVEPGAKERDEAFLCVDAHRTGSFAPLVWRTTDGGKSWGSVAGNLPADGPVKVVRQDPANPDLLFAGTELGLFASLDRGASWTKAGGLPTVAVDDIKVHPRERDLVIATHGRSLYVLDDIGPLEDLTREAAKKPLHLFAPRPALGRYPVPGWEDSAGAGAFRGKNPPEGVVVTFWLAAAPAEDEATISFANAQGEPVAEVKATPRAGLNRVSWDLKPTKDYVQEYGGVRQGKLVAPGTYTVTVSVGKEKAKAKAEVGIAPGIEIF